MSDYNLKTISTYNFYNKDWFIAADVVKHFKLSSNYNTYYSRFFSNGRLLGPTTSYEFRLSGIYLEQFKDLYGGKNVSLNRSTAVWLIDYETVQKLLNSNNKVGEKKVITVESNAVSIEFNLKPSMYTLEETTSLHTEQKTNEINAQIDSALYNNGKVSTPNKTVLNDSISPINTGAVSTTTSYSKYSEEEISDVITLLSSKLTNTPYQQEKLLNNGAIRIDLFTCTRRVAYAIELKKHQVTLAHVKEKLENKQYLTHLIKEFPLLNIEFIFSSPKGITFEALMYLQQASKSITQHKIIYKPVSSLIWSMLNKREKELPSYYYQQILDKPIIKHLLELN